MDLISIEDLAPLAIALFQSAPGGALRIEGIDLDSGRYVTLTFDVTDAPPPGGTCSTLVLQMTLKELGAS